MYSPKHENENCKLNACRSEFIFYADYYQANRTQFAKSQWENYSEFSRYRIVSRDF